MTREIEAQSGTQVSSEMQRIKLPQILRERGKVRWTLPGNTPRQNGELAINNMQALFLERFPEFIELFPLGDDGKIAQDYKEDATIFIYQRVGSKQSFQSVISSTPISKDSKRHTSLLDRSYIVVMRRVFEPWGIEFPETNQKHANPFSERRRNGYWRDPENIEAEALQFYLDEGNISTSRMGKKKYSLKFAIRSYYPGGIKALREKLERITSGADVIRSSLEANEYLRNLVFGEGEQI